MQMYILQPVKQSSRIGIVTSQWWSLETWSRSREPFLRVSVSRFHDFEYCKEMVY